MNEKINCQLNCRKNGMVRFLLLMMALMLAGCTSGTVEKSSETVNEVTENIPETMAIIINVDEIEREESLSKAIDEQINSTEMYIEIEGDIKETENYENDTMFDVNGDLDENQLPIVPVD